MSTISFAESVKDLNSIYLPLILKNYSSTVFSNPYPFNGATGVVTNTLISWMYSDPISDDITYDIYFEKDDMTPNDLISEGLSLTYFDPGPLLSNTEYYWQVIATNEYGDTTIGPVWHFMTNQPPSEPTDGFPLVFSTRVSTDTVLSWNSTDPDGDNITYDVYFAANDYDLLSLVSSNQDLSVYDPGILEIGTRYYWQIIATDEHGLSTTGNVWYFTTSYPPNASTNPSPPIDAFNLHTNVLLSWEGSDPDEDEILTYDVYLEADDSSPDILVSNDQTTNYFSINSLSEDTDYYWQVIAKDENGSSTQSLVWHFSTSEMAYINAGNYSMGCDQDHNAGYICNDDELPLHTVYTNSYYMDKFHVTNAQYAQCVAFGVCEPPLYNSAWTENSYYDNLTYINYPVLWVSWDDANSYCSWAGKRLPTEAEWEKAARGPADTRAFPWGDYKVDCYYANFYHNSFCVGDPSLVDYYIFGKSYYGLFDMAGNVRDWVNDWYSDSYYLISPYENPSGPTSGTQRVLRGGSFIDYIYRIRVAQRFKMDPLMESNLTGFRCARSDQVDTLSLIPPIFFEKSISLPDF